jgi:hypothetical protein
LIPAARLLREGRAVNRLFDRGWARWGLLTGWLLVWSVVHLPGRGFGWHYFVTGTRLLVDQHDLRLYSDDPALQSGPLAFLAVAPLVTALPARTAEAVGIAAMSLAGLLALRLLEGLAEPGPRRNRRVLVLGALVLPVWAEVAVHWAHPDDVLAMLAALGALRLIRAGRWEWSALALAAAVDSKPWALVFAPLVLLAPRSRLLRTAAVGALGVVVVWAPFWAADPGGIGAAGRYRIAVSPASVIHLLGVRATETPPWCRTAQLLLGLVLVTAAVARRRWSAALLVGVCARMLLDPATKTYYDSSLVLAAAAWDLTAAAAFPLATAGAVALVYLPAYLFPGVPDLRAALRLAYLTAAPLRVLLSRGHGTPRHAPTPDHPAGVPVGA